MCGRFEIHSPVDIIAMIFGIADWDIEYSPRYNIAPSQDILLVVNDGRRRFVKSRWGFVPSWSKDLKTGYSMINACSETAATSRSFRSAFEKQRCLVVSDGFYEWRKEGAAKKPFYIRLRSRQPFGFAGMYNDWKPQEGEPLRTSTILTTDANDLVSPIHDRMPVIVSPEKYGLWLDPAFHDHAALADVLQPYPSREMECYPVTPKVNSFKYNAPDAITPFESV